MEATGRVHQALLPHDGPTTAGCVHGARHLSLNNGAALERYTQQFTYDAGGNLTRAQHAGTTASWATDYWVAAGSNRATPAEDGNGVPVVDPAGMFDAGGNLRELWHLRAMGWSWRGCLTHATTVARPSGPVDDGERYAYGADRVRVRKVATRLVVGGAEPVVETREVVYCGGGQERVRVARNGTLVLERWTTHVSDGDRRVAVIDRHVVDTLANEVDAIGPARVRYHLTTPQGSTAVELDEAGLLVSYEEYLPHGGSAFIAGDDVREVARRDVRYAGKERDRATGLDAYPQRYYAPWLGRWLSPDPIGPKDGLNLYAFVGGDPVGYVDPEGTEKKRTHEGETPSTVRPFDPFGWVPGPSAEGPANSGSGAATTGSSASPSFLAPVVPPSLQPSRDYSASPVSLTFDPNAYGRERAAQAVDSHSAANPYTDEEILARIRPEPTAQSTYVAAVDLEIEKAMARIGAAQARYGGWDHADQTFRLYRYIVAEIETSALTGQPIDVKSIWLAARQNRWDHDQTGWWGVGHRDKESGAFQSFDNGFVFGGRRARHGGNEDHPVVGGGDRVLGVDVDNLFYAVVFGPNPKPTTGEKIIARVGATVELTAQVFVLVGMGPRGGGLAVATEEAAVLAAGKAAGATARAVEAAAVDATVAAKAAEQYAAVRPVRQALRAEQASKLASDAIPGVNRAGAPGQASGVPSGSAVNAPLVDPQLDTNIISALANPGDAGHAAAVAYANANRAAGLSVNRSVYMEFLERFSKYQFEALRSRYGIVLRREYTLQELELAAQRLQNAFSGTTRVMSVGDARAAASVFLSGERFGTADLQFYKRARDLGLNVEFVGTGNAAASAAAYIPQSVVIR